jgi:hypothetical protein
MSEPTEGIVARIAAELRREFGADWRAVAARNQDLALLAAACTGYRMALEDRRDELLAALATAPVAERVTPAPEGSAVRHTFCPACKGEFQFSRRPGGPCPFCGEPLPNAAGSSAPACSADGWYWASLKAFNTPPRIVEMRRGEGYECGCELSRKAEEYLLLEGPLKPNAGIERPTKPQKED